jgi:hypothetical protein
LEALLFHSCKNLTGSKEAIKNPDTSSNENKNAKGGPNQQTHLKDTFEINESVILFLIPDSARFASVAQEEPGIYDADADFGEGIYNTIDSISKNKKYKNIISHNTSKRYINITDCDGGPMIIDRDSVNYGIILSSKDRKPEMKFNEVHSGDYLQDVNEYFHLK